MVMLSFPGAAHAGAVMLNGDGGDDDNVGVGGDADEDATLKRR